MEVPYIQSPQLCKGVTLEVSALLTHIVPNNRRAGLTNAATPGVCNQDR